MMSYPIDPGGCLPSGAPRFPFPGSVISPRADETTPTSVLANALGEKGNRDGRCEKARGLTSPEKYYFDETHATRTRDRTASLDRLDPANKPIPVAQQELPGRACTMITGAHVILYSKNAPADREFLKDVLDLGNVDAGDGWLIFRLPPTELAVHPTETEPQQDFYLMCDNLEETVRQLTAKGAERAGEATTAAWGSRVSIRLPSGSLLPLYQPRHPLAHG